jgi:hypothetical protein
VRTIRREGQRAHKREPLLMRLTRRWSCCRCLRPIPASRLPMQGTAGYFTNPRVGRSARAASPHQPPPHPSLAAWPRWGISRARATSGSSMNGPSAPATDPALRHAVAPDRPRQGNPLTIGGLEIQSGEAWVQPCVVRRPLPIRRRFAAAAPCALREAGGRGGEAQSFFGLAPEVGSTARGRW